jgi:AraC-like DNA-binding protein
MLTLQSSLYAIAITTCLFYLGVNGRPGALPRRTYRFLLIYLLLESLGFVLEWLMVHPSSPGKSLWLGLLIALSFLVAPCLWLFGKEIFEGQPPSIRSIPRSQVALIFIGIAATLPLMQRAYWGPFFGNPSDPLDVGQRLIVQGGMLLSAALFVVQVPYFLLATRQILASFDRQSKAVLSNIEPHSINALRLLIVVVLTNWIVSILRILHCMTLGADTGWGIVFALLEVAVTVGIIFNLAQRGMFLSVEDRQLAEEIGEAQSEDVAPKYAKSSLDAVTRERIRRKFEEAIVNSAHLDSRLTLRALCAQIRENPHYVSQVLNQDLGTTFYDFINRHRIESAKALLASNSRKTVLEIALEVGFNSKSTFNTAFRTHTGMTPTEYRRGQVQGPLSVPVERRT